MLSSNIPPKFNIAFAADAGPSFINYPVPQATQIPITPGAASLTDGFPPLTFSPLGSGGVPPFGADFNGIMKQMSLWNQWQAAGGPVFFDAVFAAAVSGYPKFAMLQSSITPGLIWINQVEGNSNNPDTGGANWVPIQNLIANYQDTGTANAYVITPSPAFGSYFSAMTFNVIPAHSNTGASVINVNGIGNIAIVRQNGTAVQGGDIPAGGLIQLIYQATLGKFILNSSLSPNMTTRTILSSSSGSYTVPAGCIQLRIRMVGGGGGGGTGDGATGQAGGDGTATTFNGITASPGTGGRAGTSAGNTYGGNGGIGGTGSASFRSAGQGGQCGIFTGAAVTQGNIGSTGGSSVLGGGASDTFARVNAGFGGGGCSGECGPTNEYTGGSGGGAEYVEIIINAPVGPYTYAVGAGGAGGAASGSFPGSAGGAGTIIVDEYYGG